MNKTVNINLGGFIFHIDEIAYQKLQSYLNAVKRSFQGASGEEEIITDIEARIAELFSEKMQNERQVVSTKDVENIIEIMGQPEDYRVDEDIFEDEPKTRTTSNTVRKLYRDINKRYVAGVCSGLGYYLGLDALWVRLILLALTIPTGGATILAYVLFWILVPEARTTAEKIAMTGDPINISNIEKKIKEGFDSASETVKNADYEKMGNRAQSGISNFFDGFGRVFMTLFKIFGKFIGVILLITGVMTLIGLLIGTFTVTSFDIFNFGFTNQMELYDYAPSSIWLLSILGFFAIGIPFFFLAYLGLKILVTNLKSIGNVAKFSLLGLWLFSVIFAAFFGIKTAIKTNDSAQVIIKEQLPFTATDTLNISMVANELYPTSMSRKGNEQFVYDENNVKQVFVQDVRLIIKSTKDSIATIKIKKEANGVSHKAAKTRAEDISYSYEITNNELLLNNYLLASENEKYNSQEVELTLYLPEGMVIYAGENTYSFHRNSNKYNDILDNGDEAHYLRILNNKTECLDCTYINLNNEDENHFNIDENGINIDIDSDDETGKITIDDGGIDININGKNGEHVVLKIDKNGIRINNKTN